MQWLKDAGATGTPAEGMYLSRENWQAAWLATAANDSGIPADQEPQIAAWMWKTYAEKVVGVFFPTAKPTAAMPDEITPSGPRPVYPMKIPLTDLHAKLQEAKEWSLRPLVFSSGLSEVGVFFKYQIPDGHTIDSSQLFLMKKEDMKAALKKGMEYEGMCAPILLKLGSGSPDIIKICCDEFPAEIFDASQWSPQAAYEQDFISAGMKDMCQADLQKWLNFYVILYSDLDQEEGIAKLSDKIPHFDKLAIITIDPDSVSK